MSIPAINATPPMVVTATPSSTQRPEAESRPLAPTGADSAKTGAPASTLPPAGSTSQVQKPEAPSPADLQQALKEVQTAINGVANDLRFSIDEDTGRTLIKIVDRETDEVIKQIPSEELLRIAKALDKFQGLLVKQEV